MQTYRDIEQRIRDIEQRILRKLVQRFDTLDDPTRKELQDAADDVLQEFVDDDVLEGEFKVQVDGEGRRFRITVASNLPSVVEALVFTSLN